MIRYICLALILISLAFRLADQIKVDCVGRPAKLPKPRSELNTGIICSLIATMIILGVYYGAGLFDGLFR